MSGGSGGGCPMWVLTYADMITVLMGFFVILSTMNKPEEKENVAAELVEQFGSQEAVQRFSEASEKRNKGAAKKAKGPPGKETRVTALRDGSRVTVGGPVFFDVKDSTITSQTRRELLQIADLLRGKGHIIEVKAYRKQVERDAHDDARETVQLAIKRALAVADFLMKEGNVREDLIRIEVAAPVEGRRLSNAASEEAIPQRVDVQLLEASQTDYDKTTRRTW